MPSKECYDHLGNRFDSLYDMCKHWGIKISTYNKRVELGWSVEKILTTPIKASKPKEIIKDHLGNTFESVSVMCSYYNIKISTYKSRIESGWDLGRALTTPAEQSQICCLDHEGNKFESVAEMCRHWGITVSTFKNRVYRDGLSLEEALTTPINNGNKVYDHLGHEYNSLKEMCKHYRISVNTFRRRLKQGMSLKQVLTIPSRQLEQNQVDHLGNQFDSIKSMCEHWKIDYCTYRSRIKNGWSVKAALTTKVEGHINYRIDDGFGNSYDSLTVIAKKYNIANGTLYSRLHKRVDIVAALVVNSADALELKFIGLDGKARYTLNNFDNKLYTTRELVAKYRPEFIYAYDKHNPTGKYEPYKPNKEGTTHE